MRKKDSERSWQKEKESYETKKDRRKDKERGK